MEYTIKKSLPLIFLLCCAAPLFFLNIHSTHSPGGDDYALYIKEAQNIAAGKPFYQSNYVFNKYNNCYSPPQYPPGFPLLLAPVVKVWGLDIMAMCYFNTIIAVCLLFGFFVYFRKYMGVIAAMCLSVIISYSSVLIDLKQAVLSDETSLLFVLLYLIFRNAKTFSWRRIALLTLFATMAILIRTQSILLLFAEVIFLLLSMIKDWRAKKVSPVKVIKESPSLYVVAGCILLSLFLNKVIFYCPTSASGYYVDFLKITLEKGLLTIVRDNVNALLAAIMGFFHYDTENSIRTAMVTFMESCGLVFCFMGFVLSVSKRLSFDDIFFVLVCGLILYYPIHDARYFLPAIAIVFFYCYTALDRIVPVITKVSRRNVGIGLTVIYLVVGFRYLKGTTHTPYGYMPGDNDKQAFGYLMQHVNDSDLVICARPRLMMLYTNKRCMIHAWQYPMDTNKKIFEDMGAKYLLLVSGFVDEYYHTYLNGYQHPKDSVQIAPGYTLYTLR